MNRIFFTMANGMLAEVIPNLKAKGAGETEAAFLQRAGGEALAEAVDLGHAKPDALAYFLAPEKVPAGKEYRDAWKHDPQAGEVKIDPALAAVVDAAKQAGESTAKAVAEALKP